MIDTLQPQSGPPGGLLEFKSGMPSREQIIRMLRAGERVTECHRVLAKSGSNVVAEVLCGQGMFYQYDHYPKEDVFDRETHSQYYYHAHREGGEHGHFHTFLRQKGIPAGFSPVTQSTADYMAEREDTLCHLVAISMDKYGAPIELFTCNRWVTADNWYAADDVIAMLDRFRIDLALPSWPTNIWITNLVALFRPQIEALLRQRDRRVAEWQSEHAGTDVYEDRRLEITSSIPISVDEQIAALRRALGDTSD